MNVVNLIGTISEEPRLKNEKLVKFKISCAKRYTDAAGKKWETVDNIPCTAFGRVAKAVITNVHEGEMWYLSGRWAVTEYKDENGVDQRSNELIVAMAAKVMDIEEEPTKMNDAPRIDLNAPVSV